LDLPRQAQGSGNCLLRPDDSLFKIPDVGHNGIDGLKAAADYIDQAAVDGAKAGCQNRTARAWQLSLYLARRYDRGYQQGDRR
jgi:hypothetical protein